MREGWGSKVTTTDCALPAFARRTISSRTWRLRRCTPSKLPTLTSAGPKSRGTSSSLWKVRILNRLHRRDAEHAEFFLNKDFLGALGVSAVNSNLKLQFHSVKRQPHVGRQRGVGRLVRQVVADVREKRALRFHRVHDLQRLLHGRMRGMRLVAQRVQKQYVEVAQLLQRFGRNLAVICQVGGRSETET